MTRHLLQAVKDALAARVIRRRVAMKFPPYGEELQTSLVRGADYIRQGAIALALRRVGAEGVPGSLAEAGVYRGETSRLIHGLLPDRKLYLFDTFAGFPDGERTGDRRFSDTSAEAVLRTVGDRMNVELRPGILPATLAGLENERFAFVLLDLDRYEPTRDCLQFFHPRLSGGGYLMVHDYNSPESGGACRRAVDEFVAGRPERVMDLPDCWGTVLLRKT